MLANGSWQTQYLRDLFGLETSRTFAGGVRSRTERDSLGRVTGQKTEKNNRYLSEKSYLWGANDRLLSVVTNGKTKHFEYDVWGNLSKTVFEDGKTEHRNPDKTGNLFERLDRLDRKYESGGRLVKTENWEYKYDKEGNLIRKKDKHGAKWRYEWNDAGMLSKVKRPDATEVSFRYDALGRRIEKQFGRVFTRWVWDGNTPLHEQRSYYTLDWDEVKKENYDRETKYPLITWVFEEGTFVPAAKITEKEQLSVATNYLGTPEAMYREDGEAVWTCELNSYGKVRNFQGGSKTDCPFRYQGQYEDAETGLYYNRFRYYSPEEGMYLSQDPIGLAGNNPTLYAYVHDPNEWIDIFGCNIYSPITWTAPSSGTGHDYTVYQQNIDWNQRDKKGRTNLERANKGKAPLGSDGKPINLHHSKQNARGPLFEISEKVHRKYDRTNALHPYKVDGSGKHPINPVNRKAFGKDRKQYWKDRAAEEISRREKSTC